MDRRDFKNGTGFKSPSDWYYAVADRANAAMEKGKIVISEILDKFYNNVGTVCLDLATGRTGVAKRNPSDKPDLKVGTAYAYARLRGWKIPTEFKNLVQISTLKVGTQFYDLHSQRYCRYIGTDSERNYGAIPLKYINGTFYLDGSTVYHFCSDDYVRPM